MPNVIFYRDQALPFLEAKLCRKRDFAYQKHFHEEYSIGLIDTGETHAWCDGTMHRVEEGRMISFPPMMLHSCHPKEGVNWSYKMLFIKQDWLQGLKQQELDRLHIPFLLEEGKNKACRIHINRTMKSLTGAGTPLEIEISLIELIQTVVSWNDSDLAHKGSNNRQDRKYVNLIKEYLYENYTEKITLDDLERITDISKFHLIRLFKQSSHMPPHAYQNLLRINHAKIELTKNLRPIADIAVEAGFYDQSHFSRTFSKIVGVPPQKYANT
ncbi:AraC family transcriptional regulator [Paenibacillus chondroitinus]|uniref:AraC family transcriptional regulator n=1 Tax=Paenibacillus chondroitinus TaxID=59842 RepID=A0ABU6DEB1_9BACL|nr:MULTISPECIES: AraC family transcriptional regulator [Paenibacillus]MCY9656422.1 AraC family transcriptional regulator [Paenibacillus anseongense]MEB4795246.1 AraC family transcriptional regulator [Paenibacillus chondroitinus]